VKRSEGYSTFFKGAERLSLFFDLLPESEDRGFNFALLRESQTAFFRLVHRN
jgi:hypothetical protein